MKSIYEFLSDLARQDIKLWVEDNRLRCNAPKDVLTPEIRSQLAERKVEILSFLQQSKLAFDSRQIKPVSRPKNLPLSFAQQRLWFIEQLPGASAVYNIPAALHLNGILNVTALQKALQEIVRRHEVLRTRFTIVENSPVQVIHAEPQFTWLVVDLQHFPLQDRTAEVQRLTTQEAQTPFNLGEDFLLRVKLLRLAAKEHVLLLTMHHIIADGWSLGILVRELSVLYKAFDAKKSFSLPPLPIQYADFALWQRQELKGEVLETHLNYWKQQLAIPTLLELPTDYPRPSVQTFRGCSHSFAIEGELSKKLKTLSQQSEASLFMILLAGLGILLSRYSRQKNLIIGTAIANRNRREIEPLIGFFANTLALRLDLKDNPSFRSFLGQVRQVTLDAYAHQDLPFDRLVEELQPERSLSHTPLFQVMFALQNAPLGKLNLPNLTLKPIETKSVTAKFDLTLSLRETEAGLEGVWEYSSDLFEAATITRMIGNYKTLLEAIVANPDRRVANLPLLSEAARQQVLVEWNSSEAKSVQLPCIHELFEQQVERNPDAVAVVFAPDDLKLTYRQLNARANQLAHYLQARGVKPGVVVGICIERSPLQIIGLLGILKAGAAYLLLEPTYPQEYQKAILTDIPVSAILSQPELKEFLPEHEAEIICLQTDKEIIAQQSQENPINQITPESQAYIVYSNRRAVSVSHSAIAHHLDWFKNQFALSESDVVLHQALTQSSAVWEIFGTLTAGGCLAIACSKAQDNPAYLHNLIVSQQVSLIHFVPSELSAFLNLLNAESTQLNSLRRVFCSGESLSSKLIKKYYEFLQCSLVQLYGLPESAGEVIYCEIKNEQHRANIFPISSANGSVYVLDEQLQPVPIGVTGEIYLGSLSLAQGYLHDREATARHFIKKPFSETLLFKTNELGKILDDGSLQLIGSGDRQVWIKGFRVSLSEIETKLLEDSSVEDCRVLMRETDTIAQLVAYVVTSGQLSLEQLQLHLQVLPAYMLPSAYVPLSALPLTPTGQVDELALKRLAVIDSDLVQRWEEQLRSLPEIDRVAVVVQQQTETIPPVHLKDLLLANPNLHRETEEQPRLTSLPEAHQQSRTKKLAVVHGESLELETDAPLTLAEALQRAAFQNCDRGIIYIRCDGSEFVQSYDNLVEEAQRILAGLRKLGLKPQDKVIFQLERLQDFIPAFWGCILGGFVPVPISIPPTYELANSAVSKLHNAWQMLGKPIVLAGENSAAKIRDSKLQLDDRLKAIDDLRANQPDTSWHLSQPDDLAILLLTSGSTGVPKAVMQNHRSILSRSAATARMNNFTSKDVSLNWFPLDHVGGLVMFHLRDVYLGCQQIHAPTELVLQQPLKWLDWIEHYRATITWAPNFAYGAIAACAPQLSQKVWDLSSMRFILNGGEAIVARSARKFLELLKPYGLSPTAMHPAWGMSETCSAVIYSHSFSVESTTDESQNVELGMPIPGFSVRITDAQNQIVEEEIIGRVQVKGLSVTSGYYQNLEFNREAFTDDGWFNTGDLGLLREGKLTITGREKDVIIINGINYYAHEIESVVEEIEGVEVSYTGAVAVRDAVGDTDRLAIFFNSSFDDEKLAQLIKVIRTAVVQNIGINPDYLLPLEKESIPKTSIGKIKRSLLSKQFLAGEFDALIKRFDLLLNNNTLPNWFYRQVWQPKQVSIETPNELTPTLVFLDSLGLGTFLCQELNRSNQPCIQVEIGTEFARRGRDRYCLNPNQSAHYRYLFESLASDGVCVAQILHLWTYDRDVELSSIEAIEEAQSRGIYSLLYLIQALSQVQGSEKSVRLQIVSNHAQLVDSADKIAYQKAPILGLIKTISQEMPWLICRHVDLQSDRPEVNAALLLKEMRDLGDGEVVYRNGQRLVSRLAKADLSTAEKQPLPFKKEGIYLVTGGLGGIGLEIAKYLLKTYQARLLLVGRTVLPPRNTWTQLQHSDAIADRLQAYLSLEQLGGEINYEAVDICDRDALQQVVERVKSNWGSELDGIIHLAGIFHERLLLEETQESIAAVLRPKLNGTWVLHQLLGRGIFIHFSSVNGFFGGTGVGAYAAANSFIDRFAKYQKYQTSLQSYCFAWSMWDEMGMSRGYQHKDLTRVRGFSIVSPTQGLNSFLAGLHHNQAQLLIGLDGSNFNLRRHLKTQFYGIEKLTAYFTKSKQAPLSHNNTTSVTKTKLTLSDRFGTKSDCDLVKLEKMPLTETGAIDRLLVLSSVKTHSDRTQPQTEIERKIANIWQEVLKVPQVSIQANFFELGGHSLLATQVISRVREAFSVELPLSCLFVSPTIEGLSKQVEKVCQADLGLIGSIQRQNRLHHVRHTKKSPQATQTCETAEYFEPLSFAQQRLWFLDRLEGSSSTYNVPAALRLKGSLNVTAIEEALQKIGQRHEVLRTRFPMVEGTPVQAIASNFVLSFTIIDLQQSSEPESTFVQRLVTQEAQTPFDLEKDFLLRVKLLRLSDREHILLLTLHHIVADGWSLGILVQELSVFYEAINAGKPANLPALPIQYADFALWQRQYLQTDVLVTQLSYWKQQLQGIPPLLALPTDRPHPPVQTLRGRSFGFTLTQKLTKKLLALSQQSKATLFMTLLAAFGILLSRYSRQEDLVIGSAIANRHRQELEPLIGFFVNTLALRLDFKDNPSFREFLGRVRQITLDAYAHQDLPFERLVEEIQPERNLSHSPLFQVTFALQNAPLGELKLSGLTWSPLEIENVTAKFDLSLAMRETESGLEGVWEYNCDLFEASTIERMMGHFQVLLEGIVTHPDESITNLSLLTQKEHQQLLEWNATGADYPHQCIHELFESQVEKTPDAVAIAFEKRHLTYRELNARANQLAHFLQRLGVETETLVGLCVERSLEAIVGMLGILKAGGTYVPLDPTYPTERLAYLLKDAGVKVLLTQQQLVNLLPHQAQLIRLDTDWEIIARENCNNISNFVKLDNLAYIIYTSGSTGAPKGVLLAHRGLCNLATAQIKLFGVNSCSRVLQFASLSFDASVWEVLMALCSGARLCLGTKDSLLPGVALLQFLQEQEITHVTLPPTALAVLPTEELPALQTIIVAGEACSAELVKRWSTGRRFFNAYGPTESTVCATIAECSDRISQPSIGRPIPNTQTYILDRHLQPVPVGVPGELHIGGVGLARGYLNQPELTEAKFISNPFDGAKLLYKTGDLARYLPDGNIEYLDRIDRQVKIRGFRIELGEIEAVLAQNPHVREAIALVNEQLGHKRIIAYVVPQNFNTLDERNLTQDLRNYLKQHLPEYMMPSTFVTLDSLPLTPNGKVDRRVLAALELSEAEAETSVLPRTATEEILSKIWAEVLELEQVGINRNFFELGGDSILSIQIVAKANQAGLQLTPKQIFQHQTIAELASVVGTTDSISVKQDLVTGSVPLTPIQHWFFEQNLPEPHHFNQAVLLEVEPNIKPDLLSSAIASLLQHHDALRLQFVPIGESWSQINAAPDAMPLQFEDLSHLSAPEQQATIEATATQLQTSLALSSGLIQIVLFHLGNNKPGRLFIVIHHLAVDGVSWRILLEDLSRAYQQLARGEAIQLPPKTTSFQEWARRLEAYGRSPTLAAELNYWLAQSRFEGVIPLDYPQGKETNTVADAAVITVSLGEEETRALLQEVPSAYNTQINDVLLTALLQSFAQWTRKNSLLVDLEGHGREELEENLDLSRTVGWFTSIYPVRLQKEEQSHLGEALKSVKEQLRRVPNRGIGYGIGRYLSDRQTQASLSALPSAEVSFNYLGQFEQMLTASPFLGVAPESTGKQRSPLQKRRHLLEVNSIVAAGKLQVSWTYSEKVHQKATIERLAGSFLEALQALIAHCQSPSAGGYTPSDFAAARLNQKQLDRFMTKFKKTDGG